ncbi:uncharacterized protein CC84DRAFT_1176180 [Paraphaeosphaeria sporulosa]|uniref:Uncharacterized protein n=1 Tax=Paraphaeosphaeria sporulosa TaxID=1460663 RepID=A0A177CGN3_9PLEO|nr:uncharacterized protein CC84DRAFT_1176180 [Paraphaeosphaeria sporulosa]OAG06122.1 hypothetical protein CC84DRAFT_1176180 [Paraphaeosphaeria sporulosa]
MFPNIFYLPILLLPVLGQATHPKSVCYTRFGSKSVSSLPIVTGTKATTLTAVRVTVIVPKTTKIPSPTTSTAIQDVTTTVTSTAPQDTDAFHTTVTADTTITSVFSETLVSTEFARTTMTTGDGTSTVTTKTLSLTWVRTATKTALRPIITTTSTCPRFHIHHELHYQHVFHFIYYNVYQDDS